MKLLFITYGDPFPPRNGLHLPLVRLLQYCAQRVSTHVYIICDASSEVSEGHQDKPTGCSVDIIPVSKKSISERVRSHLSGLPLVANRFSLRRGELSKPDENEYDLVWITPTSLYSVVRELENVGYLKYKRLALGLNDVLYNLYRDSINEFKYGSFKRRYIQDWLMSFEVKRNERVLLQEFDLVHLQTNKELQIAEKLLNGKNVNFVVAPNGINQELLTASYSGGSNVILYMTQLGGARKVESEWFIREVWPEVRTALPEAELHIVGSKPKEPLKFLEDERIRVRGFVPNLISLYEESRIAVVPTFHGTGVINRVQDAIAAGLPAVSTPQAISTIDGLLANEHILSAESGSEFSRAVIELFTNSELRERLSSSSKKFALVTGASWENSCAKLFKEIVECCSEK